MEDNRRIKIKSGANGIINLFDRYSRLDMTWNKKGSIKPVELGKLKEAVWAQGVANLFIDGYLLIDEKDSKDILIELGLETPTEDADEEPIINVLTDPMRKRLMTSAPLGEFKETLKTLNYEQLQLLAEYAIENSYIDYDRCDYIKTLIGVDIIKAVELKKKTAEV